jgi:AraC-like DNA-binding protein
MNDERFFKHPALPFAECRHSINSGRRYKSHMHKTFSVGAIDQGEVIYQIEAKTAKLKPGSIALINPEAIHTCNPADFCQRSYYILHFDVEWCLQLQQSLWQLETYCPVNTALLEDKSIYRQYIKATESLMEEGDALEKEQMLVDLVEIIFIQACEPAAAKTSEPSLHIEELKRQLGMNLDIDLSMRRLSSKLQANPYTLLRQFKAATGITPHAYRLNCRIELARKLLQKGFDLSQVALECGFFDQSHFHRHFKAITTVTPKEYQVNFIQ